MQAGRVATCSWTDGIRWFSLDGHGPLRPGNPQRFPGAER